MPIEARSTTIASRHWLLTPLPGADTQLFIFSGIAVFSPENPQTQIKGVTQSAWERGLATIDADYSNVIPINRAILPNAWAVEVHLASIFNANQSVNTGWAVDGFRLRISRDVAGRDVTLINGHLVIDTDVAVRDSDAFILRLSYSASIVGRVSDVQFPPP